MGNRLGLFAGLLVLATGSFAPWFTERTFAGAGNISGIHHGGLITLGCSIVSLPLVLLWPPAVTITMTVACAWTALSAYEMPGSLASSRGGEVNLAWGIALVLGATVLTAVLAAASGIGERSRPGSNIRS